MNATREPQTAVKGLMIGACVSYTLIADEPFSARAERPDGTPADIIDDTCSIVDGKYVICFKTVHDAVLIVNDQYVEM